MSSSVILRRSRSCRNHEPKESICDVFIVEPKYEAFSAMIGLGWNGQGSPYRSLNSANSRSSRGQITFRLHEDSLFKDRSSQEFVRITCRQWQQQCQTREMKKILLNKLKFNTVTDGRLLERWLSRPARQTYSSSRAKRLPTWAANTTPKHSESHVIADTRCVSRLVSRLHGQAQRDGRRSRHKLRSQPARSA